MEQKQMTEAQGGKIHFSLNNLYTTDIGQEGFYWLQGQNSDRKFTRTEASDLIDWLMMVNDSVKGSPSFMKAEGLIRAFIQSKQTI